MTLLFELLADLVMLAHACFSLFLVAGLGLIVAGMILGWQWTRHRRFRALHLAATLFVVARAWFGLPCPFSVVEDGLRAKTAGICFLGGPFHDSLHWLA